MRMIWGSFVQDLYFVNNSSLWIIYIFGLKWAQTHQHIQLGCMKHNNGQIWLKNRHPTQYTDTAKRTNKNPTKNYDRNWKWTLYRENAVSAYQKHQDIEHSNWFRPISKNYERLHKSEIWKMYFIPTRFGRPVSFSVWFSFAALFVGSVHLLTEFRLSELWVSFILASVFFRSSNFIQRWVGKIVCVMKNLIYRMNLSSIRRKTFIHAQQLASKGAIRRRRWKKHQNILF